MPEERTLGTMVPSQFKIGSLRKQIAEGFGL
jgi:hypothetical protein